MASKGEIAYKVLKCLLQEHGVPLKKIDKEELEEFAQKAGVPAKELQKFAKPLFQEMLDEMF